MIPPEDLSSCAGATAAAADPGQPVRLTVTKVSAAGSSPAYSVVWQDQSSRIHVERFTLNGLNQLEFCHRTC